MVKFTMRRFALRTNNDFRVLYNCHYNRYLQLSSTQVEHIRLFIHRIRMVVLIYLVCRSKDVVGPSWLRFSYSGPEQSFLSGDPLLTRSELTYGPALESL